jgi:hypothetical protein
MALVVATPLLALATPRSLERLALGTKALQALPLAQRREALRAATGELAPFLRKRYALPLVPTLDLETVDTSALAGGATVSWDGGPASRVADYLVKFTVAGGSTTYQIDPYGGAYGSTYGAAVALGPSQSITIDGYTVTLTGTITTGDVLGFSTAIVQDPGISFAATRIAAHALLFSRGVDPKTQESLAEGRDAAMAWGKALGVPGEGELDPSVDRTPTTSEYGPQGSGQTTPYEWLDGLAVACTD